MITAKSVLSRITQQIYGVDASDHIEIDGSNYAIQGIETSADYDNLIDYLVSSETQGPILHRCS